MITIVTKICNRGNFEQIEEIYIFKVLRYLYLIIALKIIAC